MKTKCEEFVADRENQRLFEREALTLDASELVIGLMKEQGVTRAQMAEMLGTSRAHISQLLNGSRNMTLVTLTDLAAALGQRVQVGARPINAASSSGRSHELSMAPAL
ncbi:MAG: helix-turn-helix transcriptional regulator [Acidobacteria bacterium]|nr:helix-turn-helix transcriptional regulator [Acidobacteriota bacterium]